MKCVSLGVKNYVFVCIDGNLRYTWDAFICEKYDTSIVFEGLRQSLHSEMGEETINIVCIHSDHGIEFEN